MEIKQTLCHNFPTKTGRSYFLYLRRSRRGIALISVLAMVMLLTALVVAFMLRAGSEKQSSGYYRAEATTRDLSDTTLNLVEGEINEATTQGITYAWASQPGAIRVFDNTGAPAKTFKLYSAPSMVSATTSPALVQSFFSPDVPSSGWSSAPGMWVDLNAPVNSDPAPTAANNFLGLPQYTHFPILDPRDPTTSTNIIAMDGFALPAPGTRVPYDATNIDSNNKPNPAPMPVQWLYVLQNGTLTAPTSGPDASGNYSFAIAPNAANPIVGRIAFWTDDETCKVNINTAGADGVMGTTASKDRADPNPIANGTFWSPPYFGAEDDTGSGTDPNAPGSGPFLAGFATSQPVTGEYQRYPGHPATVALSNILNTLNPVKPPTTPNINTTSFYNSSTTIPGITPRYIYGGTQENTLCSYGAAGFWGTPLTVLPTAAFRLYPTLSESLFHPDRTAATNLNTANAAARQRMESARFFLTAHSRAPELNLFGLPRISMWPLAYNAGLRTAVDKLIAFCTTIGGTQGATNAGDYYFTRSSACDSTIDIALQDSSGNKRNMTLLGYLDYLTRQNIPGFGGSFFDKNYGTVGSPLTGENDQILTEMFDYIRATNIEDATSPSPYRLTNWQGTNWGYNQVAPSLLTPTIMGSSWATSNGTQGFGSFPRLIEATLQFIAMGQGGSPDTLTTDTPPVTVHHYAIPVSPAEQSVGILGSGDSDVTTFYNHPASGDPTSSQPYAVPGATGAYTGPPIAASNKVSSVSNINTGQMSGIPPDGTTAVQAFLLLTFIDPAQAWFYNSPYVWISISGLDQFQLNGHSLGFNPVDCMVFGSGQDWNGGGRSGYIPVFCNFQGKKIYRNPHGGVSDNPSFGNPFFSMITPIYNSTSTTNPSSTMAFTGAPITVKLYDGASGYAYPGSPDATGAPPGGHLIQTYTIPFPNSATFPIPYIPPNPNSYPALPATNYLAPSQYTVAQWPPVPPPYQPWVTPNVAYGTYDSVAKIYTATAYEMTGPLVGVYDPPGAIPNMGGGGISYERWEQYLGGGSVPLPGENLIGTGDVIESMVLSQTWSDPRLLAISNVPSGAWTTHPNWGQQFAHDLFLGMVSPMPSNGSSIGPGFGWPPYAGPAWTNTPCIGSLAGNQVEPGASTYPWAPPIFGNNKTPTTISGVSPDWDNGVAQLSDGPWINKADEGSAPSNAIPYYANPQSQMASFFSANREIPSPGVFGSLPTGVDPTAAHPQGWQTLLFRPGPAAAAALAGGTATAHPGEGVPANANVYSPPYATPPDHLWMDLFWIPMAEPYAISEPMSTAGKINLNYQILPFTYIKRATALRAAMATEKIAQVSSGNASGYKGYGGYEQGVALNGAYSGLPSQVPARYPIDLDATLTQFDAKFSAYDVFRSASQICEEFLVPMDIPNILPNASALAKATPGSYGETITPTGNYPISLNGVASFAKDWYTPISASTTAANPAPFAMVGDNVREQPYTNLYAKLTTKSNTFTVYYRVQSLKKPVAIAAGVWNENLGAVTGEYRGSTTIERFIDPNEETGGNNVVPDAATQAAGGGTPTSLEGYYKWRVVENHQFAP